RAPERNRRSCPAMYTAFWPASRGQSGLVLLPFGPWQAAHTAALVAPSAALPWVNGESGALAGVAAAAAGAAAGGPGAGFAAVCAEADRGARHTSVVAASAANPIQPCLGVCGMLDIRSSFSGREGAELYTTAVARLPGPRRSNESFFPCTLSHQRG